MVIKRFLTILTVVFILFFVSGLALGANGYFGGMVEGLYNADNFNDMKFVGIIYRVVPESSPNFGADISLVSAENPEALLLLAGINFFVGPESLKFYLGLDICFSVEMGIYYDSKTLEVFRMNGEPYSAKLGFQYDAGDIGFFIQHRGLLAKITDESSRSRIISIQCLEAGLVFQIH